MAVIASLSVSLDGFYTGPNPNPEKPMGEGGAALHGWFAHDVADRNQLTADDILRPEFERTGALVMGKDSYEHAQAAWGPTTSARVPRSTSSPADSTPQYSKQLRLQTVKMSGCTAVERSDRAYARVFSTSFNFTSSRCYSGKAAVSSKTFRVSSASSASRKAPGSPT